MNVVQEFLDPNGQPIGGVLGEPFEDYSPPSWDVYFMRLCYEAATKSKDPSSKFGAIVVKDKRPILFGFNGLPPKVKDYPERYKRPVKYKWVVHAEKNAIGCGAKYGIATNEATIYIAAMPCSGCAGMIATAGIKKVIVHKPAVEIFSRVSPYGEDDEITKAIFKEADIEIDFIEMFVNRPAYFGGKRYKI